MSSNAYWQAPKSERGGINTPMRFWIDLIAEGLTIEEQFMHGECASFALALHQLTGWPIYSEIPDNGNVKEDVVGYHVCCYCDDLETYVDIRGQASLSDMLIDNHHKLVQVSPAAIAPHADAKMVVLAKKIITKDSDWYGLEY